MKLVPYLYFHGNCEEALRFYAAAGLGELKDVARYRDGPPSEHMPGHPDWVMNASLVGDGIEFMASDSDMAKPMAGVAMTVVLKDLPKAQALFAALGAGGMVTMPFAKQFWGDDFGALTDKFGVQWQIDCEPA